MTDAKARAEKIYRYITGWPDIPTGTIHEIGAMEFIAAQIEEAQAEAIENLQTHEEWRGGYEQGFRACREKAAECVPTTWLDNILSGIGAVHGKPTDGCPYVEAVLKRIAERIRALRLK